jgi:hypothetical protein
MKSNRIWLPLITALALFGGACSHDIQSPLPKGDSATPDLVCSQAAQPPLVPMEHDGTVTLHGSNFTPMPSKTLEGKRELILPKITLTETSAIGAAVKDPITIADDPANPAASRVQWTSESLMSFTVKPQDNLATGVFTVTITNPDGKSKTTIDKGLAIVPPPVITMVKPPAICDDQSDQTLTITGMNFLFFDGAAPKVAVGDKEYTPKADMASCTAVDGNFTEKNVQECTSMTITIAKNDFPVTMPTKEKVVVTNPPPADCTSSNDVEVTIEPPPEVDAVMPSTVCEGGSQLTVTGKNIMMGATVSLDCGGSMTKASAANVTPDGTQVAATFGAGATPGQTCDVIVTNPDGCEDRPLPHHQVTAVTGPIVFYVDPPVVYNGINTRITIFATTITPPVKSVVITPMGMTMPMTQLTFNPVTGHPNRVQAIVPTNTMPGTYDLTLTDSSGCFATLPGAVKVTSDLTVSIRGVNPPFGDTADDTAVTIYRDTAAAAPMDKPFVVTPRVFLNPTNAMPNDVAVEMTGVSFVDADTATGLVPEGTPVHAYDVVLVNPDGSVGLYKYTTPGTGYTELSSAPPVVTTATPSSIVDASGQKVTLAGTNFAAGDTITVTCSNGMMPPVTSTAPTCNGASCTQNVTIDGSALPAGDVCIVRVTNPDGSYGEYSAIGVTNSSLNLSAPQKGTDMNVGRRALAAAAGNATTAARFVYAIGGDSGMANGALDTTEFAPVDAFGKFGAWTMQNSTLKSPRTLAGAATVGRYIYVIGGNDGTGPVATAERALILSPREAPVIEDVDLALGMKGLDAGEWHYRVSATFAANDTDNPNGESLPSDAFSIKLPSFMNKKIAITLVWKAPVDDLKMPLQGVNGYRIYRTKNANDPPGSEVLIGTVSGGTTLTFVDDGTATPGTTTPLPTGSTGEWAQLPNLGTKRSGPAVAAGFDPADPTKFYVYAMLGKNSATTANTSYEFLPVTVAPNGRQTVAAAWTAGASQASVGRWQLGAWVVDKTVQSNYAPDTWIFIGGGLTATAALSNVVEAGRIQAGGDLGTISNTPGDFSSTQAGYGVCAANQQLFVFGGAGASPSSGAKSAALFSNNNPNNQLAPPTLANNAWNNEGLTMTHGRYLMGSAVQSSFIFLLGGQTDEPSAASKTTELVIW